MKFYKSILTIIIFIGLSSYHSYSQSIKKPTNHIFEIKWANDFIFETDRYFSNGLELKYYAPFMEKSPVRYILLPNSKNEIVRHGITITQHFFTPAYLFSNEIIRNDRPFASYFLIGHQKVSVNSEKKLIKKSELQVGLLGKYSGGRSIQNGIHDMLWTSVPALGWEYQVKSDLAINYSAFLEKGFVNSDYIKFSGLLDIKAGIPYTYTGAGLKIVAGKADGYYKNHGLGFAKDWQLYFFGQVTGRFFAYNATLQGGLINKSNIHVFNEINHIVGEIKTGITFSHKNLAIEFGQHLLSPEYYYGGYHKWGYLTIRFGF